MHLTTDHDWRYAQRTPVAAYTVAFPITQRLTLEVWADDGRHLTLSLSMEEARALVDDMRRQAPVARVARVAA
jgi:hypothetical protein